MPQPLPWALLGLDEVEYLEAWDIQRRLVAARQSGALPDTLVLLRHPNVHHGPAREQRPRAAG